MIPTRSEQDIDSAARAVFLFLRIYEGLKDTLGTVEARPVATDLTAAIIRNTVTVFDADELEILDEDDYE